MILGIGGSSNSGKSSLANKLLKYYRTLDIKVEVLCQDDFVLRRNELSSINNHADWEVPSTIKIDEFILAVKEANKNNDIIICEGLFAFWFTDLNKLYNKKIFLKIDKQTFIERKTKDLRWGKEPKWYIEHIWESHLKYCNISKSKSEYLILDSKNKIEINKVADFIKNKERNK